MYEAQGRGLSACGWKIKTTWWESSSCLGLRSRRDLNPRYVSKKIARRQSLAGLLSFFMRKKIRTAQYQCTSLMCLQDSKSIHFFPGSSLRTDKYRSTMHVGGFYKICALMGIRTSVVALKGLRPDPPINKHNLDLPEITYAGSEHWSVSRPLRNVSS